jgi:hypothetical protein
LNIGSIITSLPISPVFSTTLNAISVCRSPAMVSPDTVNVNKHAKKVLMDIIPPGFIRSILFKKNVELIPVYTSTG